MRRLLPLVTALTLVLGACVGAPPATPSPSPTGPPSPSESPPHSPSPSPDPAGSLYLRAWLTQALPPPATFGWGPLVAISDGVLIDFNVAVPAIFPGPLMILPWARGISAAGEDALVEQARQLGLLSGARDFTGGGIPPGGQTGHLLLIVDGVTHELIGDPSRFVRCEGLRCIAEPGTPEAFAAYWRLLADISWLESELGPEQIYQPERLALLVVAPAGGEAGFAPNRVAWPLETSLVEIGRPFPLGGAERCAVVSDDELPTLLDSLRRANELTVFVDGAGNEASLIVRVLVPAEPSPCE